MGKKGNTSKGLTVPSSSLSKPSLHWRFCIGKVAEKRDEGSDLESIQSSLGGDYQSMSKLILFTLKVMSSFS